MKRKSWASSLCWFSLVSTPGANLTNVHQVETVGGTQLDSRSNSLTEPEAEDWPAPAVEFDMQTCGPSAQVFHFHAPFPWAWHLGSQLPFWEFDFHTEAVVFHDSNQAQQPFYQQPVSHKTMKLLIKLKKLSFTGVLVPTMTIPVKRFEMYFRVTWSDQPRNSSVQLPAVVSEQEPLFGDWKSCDQNVVGYT